MQLYFTEPFRLLLGFIILPTVALFFYNLSISLYRLAIYMARPFNKKAKLFIEGRKNLFEQLDRLKESPHPVVWFHCASLGEFEQGRPLIEAFRLKHPNHQILLTFFSPRGYEVRKDYEGVDLVTYLPLDTHANAEQFIHIVQPIMAVFVKYEIWHHFFSTLRKYEIPFTIISSIFRPDQIYFRKSGGFNANILRNVTHIFTQDNFSKELLEGIKINDVTVAGDTRFDRVQTIVSRAQDNELVKEFVGTNESFIIGSSWSEDMKVLIPFINQQVGNRKFIIAPHEIHANRIEQLVKELKGKTVMYSNATLDTIQSFDVLIVDTVGILAQLYRYGSFAYIGGAFGNGLHNILEAATFGLPIFFGNKNFSKFRVARDLVKLECAFPVSDTNDFIQIFDEVSKEDKKEEIERLIKHYVEDNTGATRKILNHITNWVK